MNSILDLLAAVITIGVKSLTTTVLFFGLKDWLASSVFLKTDIMPSVHDDDTFLFGGVVQVSSGTIPKVYWMVSFPMR